MRILWVTNTIFPAPSIALGLPVPVYGGWTFSLAMQLASVNGHHLAVATAYLGSEFNLFKIGGVDYYMLPTKTVTTYTKHLEPLWKNICDEFKPDIVHIHGTEYTPGLACMRACPNSKLVISIQGMMGICAQYYYADITAWQIFKNLTFRDLIRFDTLFQGKTKYEKRGEFELEYLRRTNHVIGRTSWDHAHTSAINPTVNYHFCNESLRENFYCASKWDINNKNDYTIFLSQATNPLKGLHQVIKAIALLKDEFAGMKIRIAGSSIINNHSLIEKIRLSGYGLYLIKLLKKLKLTDQVQFIGTLTAEEMICEYRNAHVFICPSSIENSPNSLGEAQIVGVPTIGSYVGGIPDMIIHEKTGLLYRFEDIEMLAENIRSIFTNNDLALQLSKNEIQIAEKRHNSTINLNQTISIYHKILNH